MVQTMMVSLLDCGWIATEAMKRRAAVLMVRIPISAATASLMVALLPTGKLCPNFPPRIK